MKRTILKSKLNKVVITEASIDYVGSITIDEDLMDIAGLKEYEKVEVNGATVLSRINTYVLKGERGTGCIEMNGGAALHFNKGDWVHILCFTEVDENDSYSVKVVYTDKYNSVVHIKTVDVT